MAQADLLFWIYLFATILLQENVSIRHISAGNCRGSLCAGACPFPRECPSSTSEGEGGQQMQEMATSGKGGARGQKTSS